METIKQGASNMARLDYVDPAAGGPELRAVADQIKQERGGRLLNLFRTLLHSPPVAAGWLRLGTAVRFETKLDGRIRELAICLVARRTGAEYEWHHHQSVAQRDGVSGEQLEALPDWRSSNVFDAREQAVLAYAEQMTKSVQVDDSTFGALRGYFDDREIVELTATIAYYNAVARFLVSTRVDIDPS
jgi:alkylhydroperoxidase family enzyme